MSWWVYRCRGTYFLTSVEGLANRFRMIDLTPGFQITDLSGDTAISTGTLDVSSEMLEADIGAECFGQYLEATLYSTVASYFQEPAEVFLSNGEDRANLVQFMCLEGVQVVQHKFVLARNLHCQKIAHGTPPTEWALATVRPTQNSSRNSWVSYFWTNDVSICSTSLGEEHLLRYKATLPLLYSSFPAKYTACGKEIEA
jgi:hypothetical protein